MNLYREEALQARSDRLDGEIQLTRSWSSWVIFWIVLTLIAITITCLFFTSFTKRTAAIGKLVPSGGAIFIGAPNSGIITNVHVIEGQRVSSGDVLFTIKDERYFSKHNIVDSSEDQSYASVLHAALRAEESALLEEKAQIKVLAEQTHAALERQMQSLGEEAVDFPDFHRQIQSSF